MCPFFWFPLTQHSIELTFHQLHSLGILRTKEPSRSIPPPFLPSLPLSPVPLPSLLGFNPHSLMMSSSICAFESPLNMLFVHLFNWILIKLLYIYEKWNHKSNDEENNGNYWKRGRDSINRYIHRLPYSVSFPRVLYDIGWIEFTVVSRWTNESIFLNRTTNWLTPLDGFHTLVKRSMWLRKKRALNEEKKVQWWKKKYITHGSGS